ncbi:pimeloyl-ACP methyl ester carboxylesterase [Bradyrhizobium japonicum]
MSNITQIGPLSALQAKLSVVFLHGLGGDSHDTWSAGPNLFWPKWLADDLENLAVYSIGYDASPSGWFGTAMPLSDRATNVLALLESEDIADRPIVFVCHSLGGLVVKQLLRNGSDFGDENWKRIREQTKAVFFIATPHTGADIATYVGALGRLFLRPTDAIQDLRANAGPLRDLNLWYRNNASSFRIENKIFFETQSTHGVGVVNQASADLGLPGVVPIPIDADHLSICKPRSRNDLIYKSIRRALEKLVSGPQLLTSPLQELLIAQIAECKRRDVKVRSPHVLLALFAVPNSFAWACCCMIEESFAREFAERQERFVTRQGEVTDERGFASIELAEHPLIADALARARADQRALADERDLFLAFLKSESGTRVWMNKRLGTDRFAELLQKADRYSVAALRLPGTDTRLFE